MAKRNFLPLLTAWKVTTIWRQRLDIKFLRGNTEQLGFIDGQDLLAKLV